MAKYKKRPDGRYATSTIVGYTDDGKPKRKTLYGRTIMELDKKVAEFKSLQNKGIIINDDGMTVEQWGKKWLELYKADKAYNTYLMYQNALNTHIIPNLGNIRLNALKSHHIQELLNSIIRDGHHRTAEIVKITIKQIIQQAIINEYIYKDISLGLTLPNKKKPKKRALTDAEKKLIFKADFNSMERVFIDLLYYTGIRKGEALSLTVSDIDFINKKISISKNLVMQYRSSTIKPSPKTSLTSLTMTKAPGSNSRTISRILTISFGATTQNRIFRSCPEYMPLPSRLVTPRSIRVMIALAIS